MHEGQLRLDAETVRALVADQLPWSVQTWLPGRDGSAVEPGGLVRHRPARGRSAYGVPIGPGADDLLGCVEAAWAFEQAIGLAWYYRTSAPPFAAFGHRALDRVLRAPG